MTTYRIGVLTYRLGKDRYSQMKYIAELTKESKKYPVDLFALGIDDIDVKRQRIYALYYLPDEKRWERRWVRFPHIIYDHVRYHPTEQFKRYAAFKKSGLIPSSYLGYSHKLGVMEALSNSPELKSYIPTTLPFQRGEELFPFLEEGAAVLKPINGTGGRDIFSVEKEGGGFRISGKSIEGRRLHHERIDKKRLQEILNPFLKREQYMMQRRIPIQYQGRTCDTRVLVQKDGKGEWNVTGMGTRIGRRHLIVSNLAKGASAMRTEQFIQAYLHRDPEPIRREIEKISLLIVQRLEERYGRFVEFGLDLGITPDGSFQLIEANSKPDRKIFLRTGQLSAYREAIRRPIEYHLYLCRQMELPKVE